MPSLQKGCSKHVRTLVLLKRDGIKIYLGLALQLPLGRTKNYVLFQVTTLTRNGPWPLASQSAVLELVLIEASSSSPASSHSPIFPSLSSRPISTPSISANANPSQHPIHQIPSGAFVLPPIAALFLQYYDWKVSQCTLCSY